MSNYIEYRDGEEPTCREAKSDGDYVEPIESESQVAAPDAEEKAEPSEPSEAKGMFARDKSGFKQPKTMVFVFAVAGLIGAFVLSKLWTRDAELSRIIVQGNRLAKTEEIERAASRFIGTKMSDVSLSDIVAAIEALPFVRKAIATKELPDAVRLRIQERQPVAIAIIGESLTRVDEAGFIIGKGESVLETTRLPLLTGFKKISQDSASAMSKLDSAETANALNFCKALMQTTVAKTLVSEARIAENNHIHALTAQSDATFIFGESDHEKKLNEFETFWKQVIVKKGATSFEYVDMRFDGKIFAKERETTNPKRKSQN